MAQTAFTALEYTPMIQMLSILLICAGLIGLIRYTCLPHSRQSALTASTVSLTSVVSLFLLLVNSPLFSGSAALSWAEGQALQLAVLILVAGVSVAGLHDRIRFSARCLLACGVASIAFFVPFELWLHVLPQLTRLHYILMLIGGSATMLLINAAFTRPHLARFTKTGTLRVNAYDHAGALLICYALLAIGMSLLIWCVKAFDGVNTAFHVLSAFTAALLCATTALIFARIRRYPLTIAVAAQALLAGGIWAGMLNSSDSMMLVSGTIVIACGIVLFNQALVALSIDEPSGLAAAICVPAMLGWLVAGVHDAILLATYIKLVGVMLLLGSTASFTLRLLCMMSVGYDVSLRRLKEGMDTQVYPLPASGTYSNH